MDICLANRLKFWKIVWDIILNIPVILPSIKVLQFDKFGKVNTRLHDGVTHNVFSCFTDRTRGVPRVVSW